MGFFEDLGKALDDFVKWTEDFDYEPVYYEEPVYEEVTDPFYAPIGDFFEFLEPEELLKKYKTPASPPDIVKDFVKAIRGEEKEKEKKEEEEWWAYYVTLGAGYFGLEERDGATKVYYSKFPNMENAAMSRMVEDYGARYMGGRGGEVYPSVEESYRVAESQVNVDSEL